MPDNESQPLPSTPSLPSDTAPPPNYPSGAWPPPPGGYYAPPGGYYLPQTPPVNATLILVFGIVGIVFSLICGLGGVFGPIAWIMGNSALSTLNQTSDPMGQRGTVNAGRICGMVATGLMALILLFFMGLMGFGFFSEATHPQGGILTP